LIEQDAHDRFGRLVSVGVLTDALLVATAKTEEKEPHPRRPGAELVVSGGPSGHDGQLG
jgi:hypothetical protein